VIRVWDCLLMEGVVVLFRVALALLKAIEGPTPSLCECLRHVVYSSLLGYTSCIVKYFRSRSFFISSPLWTP